MSLYFPVVGDSRISSGIGSRISPGGIGSTNHLGIDIAAPLGSSVIAPTDLTVISAGPKGGYGNAIVASDQYNNQYLFGHLNTIGVSAGRTISAGGLLGTVGSTGNSTGSHLHYAVRDALGNFSSDLTSSILGQGVSKLNTVKDKLLKGGIALAKNIPVVGSIVSTADSVLGLSDNCGIICQFRKWLDETHFFQRVGIVILALILIAAAFYLLGNTKNFKLIQQIAGK